MQVLLTWMWCSEAHSGRQSGMNCCGLRAIQCLQSGHSTVEETQRKTSRSDQYLYLYLVHLIHKVIHPFLILVVLTRTHASKDVWVQWNFNYDPNHIDPCGVWGERHTIQFNSLATGKLFRRQSTSYKDKPNGFRIRNAAQSSQLYKKYKTVNFLWQNWHLSLPQLPALV